MKCPVCGYEDCKVLDSRPVSGGASIRRKRECIQCGKRFTTYETIEKPTVLVIKKDQSRELFDENKVRSGILAACHKRPVSAADIDAIVSKVSQAVYNSMQEEVTTRRIGEMIMEELRQLDEVAYIRFASVYRQFTDLSTFLAEMTRLQNSKETGVHSVRNEE